METRETIELISSVFEIFTPVILFVWFLHSRKERFRKDYYKELSGLYGGWTQPGDTINPNDENIKFGGGTLMEIFDLDENGYFRGQFSYYEYARKPMKPEEQPVSSSINFFTGRIKFHWSNPFAKAKNPLLFKENRTYFGFLTTVTRLDIVVNKEEDIAQRSYSLRHFRESRIIQLIQMKEINATHPLPQRFQVTKSLNHLMDPYKNIQRTLDLISAQSRRS